MPCPDFFPARSGQRGFTLVEAVIVIVITGIIAVMVAIFIRAPIQGYVDSARRAEMTDIADTAARRIARDVRLALPNSVRVDAGSNAVEFLITRTGGRYRADAGAAGDDPLEFGVPDNSFDILGPKMDFFAGERIGIYNLGIPGAIGIPGANAYNGDTLRTVAAGTNVSKVTLASSTPFPFDSPSHRFQVVEGPVTYRCAGGELRRYWGYAITVAQANPPAGGNSAPLATGVESCQFTYEAVNQRFGLLSIRLKLTQGGESVSLYHEVHVNNVP